MSTFHASVAAGESEPLIVLTGEVYISAAAELRELATGQPTGETLHLTFDVGSGILGACEVITIRNGTDVAPKPEP